jgi:hypothetical protein
MVRSGKRSYLDADGTPMRKRCDHKALQAEAEAIIRFERRALSGAELFDRLPPGLKVQVFKERIHRNLARTGLPRLLDGKWTIDPRSLWRDVSRDAAISARGTPIKLLKDSAERAFAMVEECGPCQMRRLQEVICPDLDFVSFKKALVNRICATSRFGRTGEMVFLRAPIKSG